MFVRDDGSVGTKLDIKADCEWDGIEVELGVWRLKFEGVFV